jgi:hypothetical protein
VSWQTSSLEALPVLVPLFTRRRATIRPRQEAKVWGCRVSFVQPSPMFYGTASANGRGRRRLSRPTCRAREHVDRGRDALIASSSRLGPHCSSPSHRSQVRHLYYATCVPAMNKRSAGISAVANELGRLSDAGITAVAEALSTLPDDDSAPLCERIAQVLDVVVPLVGRTDLPDADRRIIFALCHSDRRLVHLAEITQVTDLVHHIVKVLHALGLDPNDPEVMALLEAPTRDRETFIARVRDLTRRKGKRRDD